MALPTVPWVGAISPPTSLGVGVIQFTSTDSTRGGVSRFGLAVRR